MTLLIDLCNKEHPLSHNEFVLPIARIVDGMSEGTTICHYKDLQMTSSPKEKSVILCGTALRDNEYLEHLDRFSEILSGRTPVLGICAGMQVISQIFGGTLENTEEIGMVDIQVTGIDPLLEGKKGFEAYELHSLSLIPPHHFLTLAVSSRCAQIIRHPMYCIYGVMFHPEVRNSWVVERFLHQASVNLDSIE